MPRIQIKRGLKSALPTSGMLAGEQFFTTDRGTLHVATDATTKLPVVPAIDDLTTLAAISGADDLILVHDSSEASAQKEKKITFNNLSGGTAGYIWGTDGNDGVVRMGTSMTWEKDAGDGYVTLAVNDIDCGTFGS